MSCIQGNGTTITAGTSGWSSNIEQVSIDGFTREDIDCSHLGTTGFRLFEPGVLADGTTITIDFQTDPTSVGDAPYNGATEEWTVTLPDSGDNTTGTATIVFDGYVNNYVPASLAVNEKSMGQLVIKVAGTPVITDEV